MLGQQEPEALRPLGCKVAVVVRLLPYLLQVSATLPSPDSSLVQNLNLMRHTLRPLHSVDV